MQATTQSKNGVRREHLFPGQELPLVLQPATSDLQFGTWIADNLQYLESELETAGAILFRGFGIRSAEELEALVRVITPQLVNYVEGSSPRISITDKVYTSTEYPPEYEISLHNELSYAHRWPSRLYFLCLSEPTTGGETPIADSRKVFQVLDEGVRERFLEKGVRYVRNLHGGKGVGLAWPTVFETDDREEVERYCREGRIDFEWTQGGGLRTSQTRPAAIKHPRSGEIVWFNQADQWHPSNLPEAIRRAMLSITREADLPTNAYYGDGSPFEAETLDAVRDAFAKVVVKFPWRQGDVLLLDNMLTAHGRASFEGPRRVVLAMGGALNLEQVEEIPPIWTTQRS